MPLNPKLPDKLDSGPGFLRRVFNGGRAFMIENRITTVTVREKVGTEQVGGQLKPFANGSGVSLELIVGGGGSSGFPFQLIDASNAMDGTQIRVRYGVVNTTEVDIIPDGMSIADDPPYIVGVSGTGFIWVEVTTDAATLEVTDVSMNSGASLPSPTATFGAKEIGSFSVISVDGHDVVEFAQSVTTSLGYINANAQHIWWQV